MFACDFIIFKACGWGHAINFYKFIRATFNVKFFRSKNEIFLKMHNSWLGPYAYIALLWVCMFKIVYSLFLRTYSINKKSLGSSFLKSDLVAGFSVSSDFM